MRIGIAVASDRELPDKIRLCTVQIISKLYLNAIQMVSKAIKPRSRNLWEFPSYVDRIAG
jgi:hypothetical protein